jgi:2-polyprenyl-3-methyl-5-hydroxy-6-metoxy-1,4-benzoquinol methylase
MVIKQTYDTFLGIQSRIRGKILKMSSRIIKHEDLKNLLFGQQHVTTQEFFTKQYGQYHTIELWKTPHYQFLDKLIGDPFSEHIYSHYLTTSWDYYFSKNDNTPQHRKDKIKSFVNLYQDIKNRIHLKEKAFKEPIVVCRRPDGRIVIVHGNHRAAIALKLGLDIKAIFIPLKYQLRKLIDVPEAFYGTKHINRPYQSIFYHGKELIKGRRPDVYWRMEKTLASDFVNKTVLDLGCNIGMSSFMAAERGAVKVVGIEKNPKITTAAIRLNAYFAAPCYFYSRDLDNELKDFWPFDTVMCFSLIEHLKKIDSFIATIKRVVGKVLYFEGHINRTEKDYKYLLNKENFSRIELIGYSYDGIHTKKCSRPLFRCEV